MGKKQAYEAKLRAQLDEFNAKIDVLKAKASKAEASVQLSYYETLEELSLKRELVKSKLQELKSAGDGAWEDLKEGVETAWTDLSASIRAATDRFK
jgi:chromosome segregation ATPase